MIGDMMSFSDMVQDQRNKNNGIVKIYKDYRYINAGTIEVYRWGHKAQDKVRECMQPNSEGYYSIPVDGGRYWTIGTSEGQYGEYVKYNGGYLSVNRGGYAYAKAGTPKADIFMDLCNGMLEYMSQLGHSGDTDTESEDYE